MKGYRIRAHHGMCLAFFEGKGYSSEFTKHMGEMKRILAGNPEVTIVTAADDICAPCPNNEAGTCAAADKVAAYDGAVLSLCGIEPGATMCFQEFEKLVDEKILTAGKRKEICGSCQWDSICSSGNGPE